MQAIKELIKESEGLEMRLKSSGGENSNFKELCKKKDENLNGLQIFIIFLIFCFRRLTSFFIYYTKNIAHPPPT